MLQLEVVVASGWLAAEDIVPVRALVSVLNRFGDFYEGSPLAIPLPENAPSEVPAVVLSNKLGNSRIEIARSRLNFRWTRPSTEGAPLEVIVGEFGQRMGAILEDLGQRPGRLGLFVARLFDREEPGTYLAKKYCNEHALSGPLNRPEGFEVHAHKVYKLSPEFVVNSWVRLKTAKRQGGDYDAIAIEQDLNTLGDLLQTARYDRADIVAFFDAAIRGLDEVIGRYFPELGGDRSA